MWAVNATDVSVAFGDERVLADVDVAVERAKVGVVMGPNGVGKSVLLSCLAGCLAPDAGEVSVLGTAPGDASADVRFMLEEGLTDPELTGRENVAFHADLHPRFTDRWRDLVSVFDVADDLDRRVAEYSSGMVRKLELAIALSADVPLYLLDEPTAELDMAAVDTFHGVLRELRAEGRTVIATSHRPVDAHAADHVTYLADDGVVARGTPSALLEAVPRVVRLEGGLGGPFDLVDGDGDALLELVRDGTFFEAGYERRGFLGADATVADVEAVFPPGSLASATVESPRVADLFNYYAQYGSASDPAGEPRYEEDLEVDDDALADPNRTAPPGAGSGRDRDTESSDDYEADLDLDLD